MQRTVLLLLSASLVTGCGAPTLGAASCPHPVLLGPVDRVGGHRAAPLEDARAPKVSGSAEAMVQIAKGGNNEAAKVEAGVSDGSKRLGADILVQTNGQPDRDVRVSSARAGGWVLFMFSYFGTKQWAELDGRVVTARRDVARAHGAAR